MESELAKVLEKISNHSTFPQDKNCRFFENYTEDYCKLRTSWEESVRCTTIPGSKPLSLNGAFSSNEGSTQPQATPEEPPNQLTSEKPESSRMTHEYRSFRYNMPLLRDTIGTQISILWLAQEMWAKCLITDEVYQEVTHPSGSLMRDKHRLLDALRSMILTNTANFDVFLKILDKEPALEDCCKKLKSLPGKSSQPYTCT